MPVRTGKEKNRLDEDSSQLGKLDVHVQHFCSINAPSWRRMGHVSFVHPRNGLLCVMGGCDVTTLTQPSRSLHQNETQKKMPFVEWWNTDTHVWDVEISEALRCFVVSGADASQEIEGREGGSPRSSPIPSEKCPADFVPMCVPSGFSWPTLAAVVVDWEHKPAKVHKPSPLPSVATSPSPDQSRTPVKVAEGNETRKNANIDAAHALTEATVPSLREHPMVLFIGGWNGNKRVSRAAGFDMSTGIALHVRGGSSSGPEPLTCSTVTVVRDRAYVFGGNGSHGCSSAMQILDLSTLRWCEEGVGERGDVVTASPLPRSSHVAGVLQGRYIVFHGGRRLERFQTTSSTKGKKAPKKVDPKAVQPIRQLGVDFCNDVAVYDVERNHWVAASISVGNQGPPPRYGHAACVLGPNELLLHGGVGVGGNLLSDAWIMCFLKKDESSVSIFWVKLMPSEAGPKQLPARAYHALALGVGRRLYMTGGINAVGSMEDVCVMDVSPVSDVMARLESRRRTVSPKTGKLPSS